MYPGRNKRIRYRHSSGIADTLFALLVAVPILFATNIMALAAGQELESGIYAVIDGEEISEADFEAYFYQYLRENLYHKPAESRMTELRAEAFETLVEQRLALHEAQRRGIAADADDVDNQIQKIEEAYRDTPDWEAVEAQIPQIRIRLTEQSIFRRIREEVRTVEEPDEATLRAYVESNQDLFTEPASTLLSVILVAVDPSSLKSEWKEARAFADGLYVELTGGMPFADLAKRESNHESAAEGGDLGYVHEGQVPKHAQDAIDRLANGEFTAPVQVLEGYTIFQVRGRRDAHVMAFEDVRDRALALYSREMAGEQWTRFIGELRASSEVIVQAQHNK